MRNWSTVAGCERMSQCITHVLIHSPLRIVLKPLEETSFLKHLSLFFIMLTEKYISFLFSKEELIMFGVSIKPGLI